MKKRSNIIQILSICIFISSLFFDAFTIDFSNNETIGSLFIFSMGWLGILAGEGAHFVWLANPLIIISWFLNKNKAKLMLSLTATLFSGIFLFYNEVLVNEAGHTASVESFGIGFKLWGFSILITTINNLFIYNNTLRIK